jgi:lipopolysaccharide/colanic/teichoic acid biosynthesis glycosyltransferase
MNMLASGIAVSSAADLRIDRTSPVAMLGRRRWQVLIGLVVAVAVPAVIRWPDSAFRFTAASLNNALLGTAAALLLGYYLIRKLAAFPGLLVFSFILPTFSITYGLMAAGLLLTRHDYSRFELVVSFFIAVAFYHYAFLVERRTRRPRLAVVPRGNVHQLIEQSTRVDWTIWPSPDQLPDGHDGLVADLRADLGQAWEAFLARCALAGIPVYHSKQVQESLTGRVDVEHLSENNLGSLIPSSVYARLKCALDILLASLVLPLVVLICAVAAVLIRLDSPGPVLFTQDRVGYRGRTFRIYKLRTMRVSAEGAHYTEGEDPRITRVGAFLRKYRVDELPQVFNILRGEMSWIGPRPEAQPLAEWYEREIAFYSYRHIVRPGITGWAQVNQGYVARPEMVKFKLHFDFYYIKNFSPWLDLVITAQTIRTVLTGFGSR